MKSNILLMALFFLTLGLSAQDFEATFSGAVIPAEEVPTAVLEAQAQLFPGITVRSWRKKSATSQRGSFTSYVAAFNANGTNTRAKYKEDGTGISTYTTYTKSALPTGIQDLLNASYADYKLTAAAELTALQSDKSGFRLRLRNDAKKLVIWVDENGQEITGNQIPNTTD